MKTKNKVGRPQGKNFTTVMVGVTKEEAETIIKAHRAFEDANDGLKISKSQFLRKLIFKSLNNG